MGLNGLAQIRLSTLQPLHFSPMKLRDRLEPQRYEQRLQETRWERKAETKQVERLSAILSEESEFCQSQRNFRQGRLVCPFPYTSETLPTVPKRPRIP
jgi:hypothetical protein